MQADQVPAEIVEAAAHAIFAQEQCDKRQARDVPYQWNTRLNEADHEEYRDLARHALAAVYREVQARALEEAADDTNCLDDSDLLRTRAAALRTPTEETDRG